MHVRAGIDTYFALEPLGWIFVRFLTLFVLGVSIAKMQNPSYLLHAEYVVEFFKVFILNGARLVLDRYIVLHAYTHGSIVSKINEFHVR